KEARPRKPPTFPKNRDPEHDKRIPATACDRIPMPVLHTLAEAMTFMEQLCAIAQDAEVVARAEQLRDMIDDALFFHGS
uniref:hypothetical protein n=1 Tax=Xanthomonas arboricola TaxID=56448 RepID=UPI001CBD2031